MRIRTRQDREEAAVESTGLAFVSAHRLACRRSSLAVGFRLFHMTESASSVAPAPPAEPPAGQQKEAKVIKQKRVERAARRAQKKAGEQRDEAVKVQQAAARFKAREWAQIKTATPEQLSLSLFSWNVRLFPYLLHLDHGCSVGLLL